MSYRHQPEALMQVKITRRKPGTIPFGALLMAPLFFLPLGAWLVETGWITFGTCGMKLLVGIPCLTCGATRATVHLFHGHFLKALSFQPMILAIYAALMVWGIVSLVSFATDKHVRLRPTQREATAFKVSLLLIPLANWAYLIAAQV